VPRNTNRRRLWQRALDHYGYVTTEDARQVGVPPVELRKIAKRGGMAHVGHGVYRFDDVPRTPEDPYMEAVLQVGPGAFLTQDAVLALHHLALVAPKRMRVGANRRVRTKVPNYVEVVRQDVDAGEITTYEGIPATTIARALIDSRGLVMNERLIEAAEEALERGLLLQRDFKRVMEKLDVTS